MIAKRPRPRTRCGYCGKRIAVLATTGKIRGHGWTRDNTSWCPGSGAAPARPARTVVTVDPSGDVL